MDPLSSYPPGPLDDLLSPSFFDGFEDISCFPDDQPASLMHLHIPPPTHHLLDASALAGKDVCLDSTTFFSCTAGSSPAERAVLKRRYVGYSLDDCLRVGQSHSTSCYINKTGSTASAATRTSSTASTNCRRISPKRSIGKARRNIESESARRKQMTRLFHTLWSLLPSTIPQGNRVLMIDETCRYIKDLQKKLAILKLRKTNILGSMSNVGQWYEGGGGCNGKNDDSETLNYEESMNMALSCEIEPPYVRVTSTAESNVRIIVGGYVRGPSRFFSTILHILEMKGLDVTSANCSQGQGIALYAIHARQHRTLSKEELGKLQEMIYFEAESKL